MAQIREILRIGKRKKIIFFRKWLAAVLLTALLMPAQVHAMQKAEGETDMNLELHARAAVLMDAVSGRVLYGKNETEILPMASTTKIMTCILALEWDKTEEYATASAYAASMPKVKLGVRQGEVYQIKDLLYSLMLESHNDAAVVIAEHIAGSCESFAGRMNRKAREIGCRNTFFITPNGLDATATGQGVSLQHSTTAEDLAKIMSYCILRSPKKEEFLKITGTPAYRFCAYRELEGAYVENGRTFQCQNHNALLDMQEGAISGKTGFTGKAGYCYVGAVESEGRYFVVALLACGWPGNRGYKWQDTKTLLKYGMENYRYKDLDEIRKKEIDRSLPVEGGAAKRIGEVPQVRLRIVRNSPESVKMLLREEETYYAGEECLQKLTAPVEEDTQVGKITYYVDGRPVAEDVIVTGDKIDKIDYRWCLERILCLFLGKC